MQHSEGFIKLVNEAKPKIKECTVDDIYKMYTSNSLDGLLVDTREESEFANGYIPNAIHISKGIIESVIEKAVPNKNLKMYFYCGGGFRSALVADSLQSMGYKNVISVDGGWRAWNAKNYPTISPSQAKPNEFLRLVNDAKSNVKEITTTNLYNMYSNESLDGVVIDVREDSEFAQFHIPGATHLSKGQIEVKIENLIPNKDQKIYLYCGSGYRSALAAFNLQKMGYTNTVSVSGGIQSWINNNYPITQEG
ncbi:rhodanese [Allofrancisella guangzhouensis]|uniref:Rhodanese n=1 Tax=Allofrancisella guangzhouensis TaxID=594679 RepID=A0A0A8E3I4_9GAMM|nr:rhodanese-like domain-containing protein [Allofrancisella guangzhouensis]AJC48790.1 rhodanese [Allofrancisella guangzhouensis]MBK2028012.1 rhodanese [Allofrancisella guangzhouensis]MBK2044406.1 rhodanese [Allofrancisella guangzhouensis]MBK2045288.1 rhodanese [Allofrancisella guangzhouensis]